MAVDPSNGGKHAMPDILAGLSAGDPFLVGQGEPVTVGAFLERVSAVAQLLEGQGAAINLCEHRASFLAAFAGARASGCTTLLPASRAAEAIAAVMADVAASVVIDDADVAAAPPAATPPPSPGDEGTLMIGYTSGSTGRPSRHAKHWATVVASTRLNGAAIRAALPEARAGLRPWIVGTVPSQHMYGMELTVLLPLLDGMGLHGGRPLLAADVAAALAEVPAPRVLVSTPAHLRAIVAAGVALPHVDVTVSATAPLDAALAVAVEAATGGVLLEMFGATETCILGTRETARATRWNAYPGVQFTPEGDGTRVEAPWFRAPQQLFDIIETAFDGTFSLTGRSADLIDVAGKRASLADLTQRVLRIPGVIDAAVFQPDGGPGLVQRVAALVVAPGLTAADVRAALEPAIDPVFLPRPLLVVAALPRTTVGKLPREALTAALAAATRG